MRRDMDLVRAILLEVESWGPDLRSEVLEIEGWDPAATGRHAKQMLEAGFLTGGDWSTMDSTYPEISVSGLTWHGAELADAIRDDGVWDKVKKKAAEVAGGIPIELVKPLALQVLRARLGIPE